ncbi:MAG: DUF2586 family protein [Spirochaetales bacterium]|nr:DUF2586 family protein [Spirochaetales bacterium]
MLPNVRYVIKDGAMGVLGADATGNFAAIGVAANYGQGILTFTSPDQVTDILGDGPLRDLLVSALSIAKTKVYALAMEGTIAGNVSTVTPGTGNSGTGTLTVTGSPRNEYDVTVTIISDGGRNTGTFRVTVDGREGKRLTIPVDGVYEIPGTGLTITFSETGTFIEGDTHSFSSTAPTATNAEILEAVDTVIAAKLSIEFCAIAGISNAALWAALAAKAESAASVFQYLFFVAQARYLADTESIDTWAGLLTGSERGSVESTRLQVCAGWIEEADSEGQIDTRGLIRLYCGMLARRNVHEGPDAVRYGAIPGAISLMPSGIHDGHIENLKNAGYVTARTIMDMNGIYITSGQMMSGEGSDFDLVERRRVMDKACRQIRQAQLVWLNDVVSVGSDGSPEGTAMLVAQSEVPLKIMVNNREISSGEIVIPEGQNILATKEIKLKIRIVPLGKLSYIENEIAFSNPAIGGE